MWTLPEPVPSIRDLESGRINPLTVDVLLPGLTPSSLAGSQASAGTSRLKELQERLQSRTPESPAREAEPLTWREHPVWSFMISNYKNNAGKTGRREDIAGKTSQTRKDIAGRTQGILDGGATQEEGRLQ